MKKIHSRDPYINPAASHSSGAESDNLRVNSRGQKSAEILTYCDTVVVRQGMNKDVLCGADAENLRVNRRGSLKESTHTRLGRDKDPYVLFTCSADAIFTYGISSRAPVMILEESGAGILMYRGRERQMNSSSLEAMRL